MSPAIELVNTLQTFLTAAVRMAVPLVLAGLGETYSEKSGILNIGLEGIMLFGAFASFITAHLTNSIPLGLAAGMTAGCLIALLHAFMSITCRADQTVSGLSINFLVSGLTSYLFLMIFGKTTTLPVCPTVSEHAVPLLSKLPIIGPALFEQNGFVYFTMAAVLISWILFYRTEWGVILHAAGEHPQAADSAGLNVSAIRYGAAAVNGMLTGLAGSYLTLSLLGFFLENLTSGKGYIALAVVILGRRDPKGVLLAGLLIGAADALQFRIQASGSAIPSQVFIMFPYVITVAVLLFSIGRSSEPAALGKPFVRSRR
jgi:general nucleoside transport system permease protein